jgi:hypothetical protein
MEEQYIKIDRDGNKFYYQGKAMTILHRLDGPAVERANGSKSWFVDGKRHRLDGPAVEDANGDKAWWVDGKELSEEAFNTLTKPLEPLKTMNDKPTYAMLADMRDRALFAERELTSVTAQRDMLVEALEIAADRFRYPEFGCNWEDVSKEIESALESLNHFPQTPAK